jgi:hypothetical protein
MTAAYRYITRPLQVELHPVALLDTPNSSILGASHSTARCRRRRRRARVRVVGTHPVYRSSQYVRLLYIAIAHTGDGRINRLVNQRSYQRCTTCNASKSSPLLTEA